MSIKFRWRPNLRYLRKFGILLGLFVLVAHTVVFFEETQSFGQNMKPEIGIAAPIRNERVCIFYAKSDAYVLPEAFYFDEIFRGDSSPNRNVDYLRGIWMQDPRRVRFEMVSSDSEILEGKRQHFYPALISEIGSRHRTFVNYFEFHSARVWVSQSLGWVAVWIRDNSRTLALYKNASLALNSPQGPNRHPYSNDTCTQQSNGGHIFRSKQSREIAIRITFGPMFLFIGCLLIYHVDGRRAYWRLWRCLLWLIGPLFVGIGLGAFVLPVYWNDGCEEGDGYQALHRVTWLWLVVGGDVGIGCFPRVRDYAAAADASSPDCFAGASTIRAAPMIASTATAIRKSRRSLAIWNASTAITAP